MIPAHDNKADPPAPGLRGEAEFIEAERRLQDIQARIRALDRAPSLTSDEARQLRELALDERGAILDAIALSPPITAASAAVKVRTLVDPDYGIDFQGDAVERASLHQVLAFLERQAGRQ